MFSLFFFSPQPVESSVVPDHSKPALVPTNPLTRITAVRNHIPYSVKCA